MKKKFLLLTLILLALVGVSFGLNRGETRAENTPGEGLIARGTEPFWSVSVGRDEIVFSSPTTDGLKYPDRQPMTASGRPADWVLAYRLRGNPGGFLILRKDGTCTDGMSDNVYPYNATLILGSRVLDGCAEKK